MIEKVIKKLEYCAENKCDICQEENGSGFPWIDGRCYGFTERLYDALALLKAQEPMEPTLRGGIGGYWYCGACNYQISRGDKFCRYCGQAVKWK